MTFGQMLRVIRILHFALLASVAMYAVVLAVVVSQPMPDFHPPDVTIFEIALGAVAVAVQVAIVIVRNKQLPKQLDGAPIDDAHVLDERERMAMNRLRPVLILTWALCEACAIFGLVLGFLARDLVPFVPFAVVGFASMAWYRPTRALVEGVVRGANG